MTFRSLKLPALAGALVGLLIAASPVAAADNAKVRVLHASPDAPAVDVYVNGEKVGAPLADLEFGDLSEYVSLPAGTYDIKVCAAADPSVCPIDASGIALTGGTHYTIAATNVLASIEAQVITDAPAPTNSKTQVRVVHFSADTPAVDVLTQDGSAKVVESLAYPDATDYLTLDPGSYDLKVCAAADNTVCPLDPPSLDLASGHSYSVFAIGSLDGGTLTAAVGVDAVKAPETDTESNGGTASGSSPALLLLAAAFVLATVGSLRYAARRTHA
jgi:Domain of unknown function (DUF4397)